MSKSTKATAAKKSKTQKQNEAVEKRLAKKGGKVSMTKPEAVSAAMQAVDAAKAKTPKAPKEPDLPIWLNGYAARTNAASALKTDLWAKALAIEDAQGHRAVIVTTDLIGLPAEVSNAAAARLRNTTSVHFGDAFAALLRARLFRLLPLSWR